MCLGIWGFYVRDRAVGTGALTADCRSGRTEVQCVWGFGDSCGVRAMSLCVIG